MEDLAAERVRRLFGDRFVPTESSLPRWSDRPPTDAEATSAVPGRTRPERTSSRSLDDDAPIWARHPQYFDGYDEPFFTIGALAEALRRHPTTLRAWIRCGWLPEARYRNHQRDPRGSRRLYTRAQISGLVRLADEERLLDGTRRNPGTTGFPERTRDLFLSDKS